MFLIILVFFIALLLGYQYYKDLQFAKHFEKIPQKSELPFVGHSLQLGFTHLDIFRNLHNIWRELGYDRCKAFVGRETYVIITNPKDLEVVLSSQTLIDKMNVYRYLWPGLGSGLITGAGNHWKQHRRVITPSFHFQILHNFLDSMNENCDNFIQLLSNFTDGSSFDCVELIRAYTLDIICETAMGIKVNALKGENMEYVKSVDVLMGIAERRMFSAYKKFDFLYLFTNDYRLQCKYMDILLKFTRKVIENRKQEHKNGLIDKINEDSENSVYGRKKRAFLDTLLLATIDGEPLSDQDICDETVTLTITGHDTVASALSFCFYCLSKYPEIQQKVFDEQYEIYGNDKSRHPTYQEISEMPYLDLFIKEVLRMYPSAPMVGRCTKEPFDLNGTILPPDTNIMIYIYGVGYNPKYFENPEKFDPERFSIDNRHGKNPFDYIPFSGGPRNCIGSKFGLMELKLTLSKLVRNFIFTPANEKNYELQICSLVVLRSENGVKIGLKNREYS